MRPPSTMKDLSMGEAPGTMIPMGKKGPCACSDNFMCDYHHRLLPTEREDVRPHPPGADTMVVDYEGKIDGGGIKASMYAGYIEKPPMELVPQELSRACARAMGYGAEKYAPNNWRRGIRWGEVFGALKRHLDAWNEGEDIDSKEDGGSGLNHLDHAAACLGFLCHMVANEGYKKLDDRP